MMYRRTEEEDESGSDWDELTPRDTTSQSPAPNISHQSFPPPSVPPAPLPAPSEMVPSTSPKQETTVLQNMNIPALLTHDTKTSPRSLNSVQISVSTSPSGPGKSAYKVTDTMAGVDTVRPFQDELTSIAGVKTPQPPPLKTPPPVASVYRVQQEEASGSRGDDRGEGEGGQGEGPEGGHEVGGEERWGGGGGGGGGGDGNEEYSADLEFTVVSGQKVDYLSPSTQPPHAYMSDIADKWEGHAQRWVQEVCSTLRLVTDFIIAVLLGSLHCFLHHVARKLCFGLGHILADSLFKPLMVLCFNGLFWPMVAAFVQLSRGFVLVMGPLLELLGVCMSWVVQVARSCRLVLISNKTQGKQEHQV